jgi:hypothetical protein
MKRKMRRFEEGGMADDTENMPGMSRYSGGRSGMSMSSRRGQSEDEPKTFAQAFREARKAGDSTFTWQGKKYTTEMAGAKKAEAPKEVKVTKTETSVEAPAVSSGSRRGPGGRGSSLPEGYRPKVGSGRYDDPTSRYVDRVTAPFRKLGDVFGLRKEEDVMRNMGVSREEARRRLAKKEEAGMYHGGSVKKMAGGGMARSSASRRADGIAKKGKTRGRIV